MQPFEGKIVMVTGASGGVGPSVVAKFAEEGANIVLVGHSQESVEEVVEQLGDQLNDYLVAVGDLGKLEDVDRIIQEAEAKFGQIDVLAHVAGGFHFGKPVHEEGIDVLEKMLYLNTRLTYLTCGRVAKHMVDHNVQGSIVAVLARSALTGGAKTAAYNASKAAAQRIIESMAIELREHNIRVNGVLPSIIDTEANRRDMPNADFSKWVTPKQIADAMAFLASDAASSISGDSLKVYHKL